MLNKMLRTAAFDVWLSALKDIRGKARIIERIRSAERGNFGDCASVGDGVSELRIHYGPGYRIYFARRGKNIYILLCGGTTRGQRRDIIRAKTLAGQIEKDKQ